MVTPLRDGMNLVAKEYVAAQDADDPGVLILSQFAGAVEEMGEALIVNPYNVEESADAIRIALEMKLDERRARYESLMAAVRKHDVKSWYQSFLAHLERVRAVEDPSQLAFAGAHPRSAGKARGDEGGPADFGWTRTRERIDGCRPRKRGQ